MQNDQVTPKETAVILELAEQCLPVAGDFVELGCYRGDTSVLLGKLLAKYSATCGEPVDNLCKNTKQMCKISPNLCKNHDLSVENRCKNSGNAVENLCKTCAKVVNSSTNQPRRLWIYDSFAGLPEKTTEDASGAGQNFQAGELSVTKREVIEKLRRANLHNVIVKKAWFDQLIDQDLPDQIAFAFLDGDLYNSIKTSLKLVVPRLQKQGIMIVHDYNNPELPGSSRAVDEFLRAHPKYHLTVRHTLAIITQS